MKYIYDARVLLFWTACFLLPVMDVSAAPACLSNSSDSDGDGYGWENNATCIVSATPETVAAAPAGGLPECASPASDSNGDGYGWENNASCRVVVTTVAQPVCRSANSDPDNDGFGWENNATCIVETSGAAQVVSGSGNLLTEEKVNFSTPACSDAKYDPDGDGFGWENSRSCSFFNMGDDGRSITDVILVTGQSNALGGGTSVQDPQVYLPALDSAVKRVYAYSSNGWGVASLKQIWDLNWYPRSDIAGPPSNNFAFHFGKSLVRLDSDAVVGIIMITAPGMAINHWSRGGDFFAAINSKVQSALDALPGEQKVSGILWHQGESDYYGSDYYSNRLNGLIGDFRAQSWFARDGVFVCGETLSAPVNERLARLNTDGDRKTGCVPAGDLESVGDGVHFNAKSLRKLGYRYAVKYQELTR